MTEIESRPKSKWPAVLMAVFAVVVLLMFWPKPPQESPTQPPPPPEGELHITCTFLPMYVFAMNVVGNAPGVTVDMLVPGETGCPHSYSLRVSDLRRLATSDVVIANGLGLEGFVGDIVRHADEAELVFVSSDCDVLRSTACDRHDHAHEGHDDEDDHGEATISEGHYNPHVWVSPAQAALQVQSLARQLGEIDPSRAAHYEAHADAYVARLTALLEEMKADAATFTNRKIVTFHDAFDYLARDLDLDVVATLTVDPDQGMSAREMTEVIETIQREQVAAVFAEPAYSRGAAETIAREAGIPVYELNPFNDLAGTPTADAYERVMRQNLEQLNKALGTAP